MGLLPNPWVLLAGICAIVGAYVVGHHNGYDQCDQRMKIEVARANDSAREREHEMSERTATLSAQLAKANQDAKDQINRLQYSISTGSVRLSVPTSGVQACSDPAAPSGDRHEARAELDAETAQSLVSIAADGDFAIRQLNACIDAYNEVREKVNADR